MNRWRVYSPEGDLFIDRDMCTREELAAHVARCQLVTELWADRFPDHVFRFQAIDAEGDAIYLAEPRPDSPILASVKRQLLAAQGLLNPEEVADEIVRLWQVVDRMNSRERARFDVFAAESRIERPAWAVPVVDFPPVDTVVVEALLMAADRAEIRGDPGSWEETRCALRRANAIEEARQLAVPAEEQAIAFDQTWPATPLHPDMVADCILPPGTLARLIGLDLGLAVANGPGGPESWPKPGTPARGDFIRGLLRRHLGLKPGYVLDPGAKITHGERVYDLAVSEDQEALAAALHLLEPSLPSSVDDGASIGYKVRAIEEDGSYLWNSRRAEPEGQVNEAREALVRLLVLRDAVAEYFKRPRPETERHVQEALHLSPAAPLFASPIIEQAWEDLVAAGELRSLRGSFAVLAEHLSLPADISADELGGGRHRAAAGRHPTARGRARGWRGGAGYAEGLPGAGDDARGALATAGRLRRSRPAARRRPKMGRCDRRQDRERLHRASSWCSGSCWRWWPWRPSGGCSHRRRLG